MTVPEPKIVLASQWGARPPRYAPTPAGKPIRGIFHHTAGHHGEISNPASESREELYAYARAIQADHMSRQPTPYNDSGHNFLIGRNGLTLEGRAGTVSRIRVGRMVVSAHCPGQNDQPGVEHEHVDGESLTAAQYAASVALYAWIFDRCGIRPTEIEPHGRYYPTSCPGDIGGLIPRLRLDVAKAMTPDPAAKAKRLATLRTWILTRVAEGWSWQRIKRTANWREYTGLGGT